MRHSTILLGFCVALTAVLAVPAPPKLANSVLTEQIVQKNVVLHNLSSMQPRDYFTDLIRAVLGMSVKDLLGSIESTFKGLDGITREGVVKLDEVITQASPQVQEQIKAITNDAINKVFETLGPFLEDLGLVLPIISSSKYTTQDSAADIIWALLGISLEDLVIAIANAMDRLLELLGNTIDDLKLLATQAQPEVGASLVEISERYLNQGRALLIPILDKLRQLVDPSSNEARRIKSTEIQNINLLDATISTMTGFNVEDAAFHAELLLPQLIQLFESTREELNDALALSADTEVQTKVMVMYDKAMNNVIRVVKPILRTLIQFQGEARHDKRFTFNLMSNLLGIDLDEFKSYMHAAIPRVEDDVKLVSTQIVITSLFSGGIEPAVKVWGIVQRKMRDAGRFSAPLLEILKPILFHKKSGSEFEEVSEESEWPNNDSPLYNRDELINAVSQMLNFNVSHATKTLKNVLVNLDSLMDVSIDELDGILVYGDAGIRQEILSIMNQSLTDIHITLQPMLDVLLPFLPDHVRSNKDVAFDIYNGINRVKLGKFLEYCSTSALKVRTVTHDAMIDISSVAERAGPEVHKEVVAFLIKTDNSTQSIVKPFIDIVGHIFIPFRKE